jgi:hypothetical protein
MARRRTSSTTEAARPLRCFTHPRDRKAKCSRLMLDPLPRIVWRGAQLRRGPAFGRGPADIGGEEFLMSMRLDPGKKFAALWHRKLSITRCRRTDPATPCRVAVTELKHCDAWP